MRCLLLISLLLLYSSSLATTPAADKDIQCRNIKQEIRRVHSRMRAGYSARAGTRLAARLRKLQRQRARACR